MKKRVTIEELNELTESQKETLRMLWKPQNYDIVVTQVCIDVEDDTYDYEVYLIKEIIVNPINQDKKYIASKNPVHSYDYYEMFFKGISLRQSDNKYTFEDDYSEKRPRNIDEVEENIILISKNDCTPLPDISTMIGILYQENCNAEMLLELVPDNKICSVEIDGRYFESSCLCCSLWEALKKAL